MEEKLIIEERNKRKKNKEKWKKLRSAISKEINKEWIIHEWKNKNDKANKQKTTMEKEEKIRWRAIWRKKERMKERKKINESKKKRKNR